MAKKNEAAKPAEVNEAVLSLSEKIQAALEVKGDEKGQVAFELDSSVFEENLPKGVDAKTVKAVQKSEQQFTVALEHAVGEKTLALAKDNEDVTGGIADVKLGHNRASASFATSEEVDGAVTYGVSRLTYRAQATADTANVKAVRANLAEKAKKLFG